ncbi:MAG TPA: hydroxysqualene dehydroxylase HpnE [Candidatus Binatia bacterium]|nr:hydroxysqualene dehydroxylase HpnE [Candidatus Binatia bacterium]
MTPPLHVAVLGGGFAGLAAGVRLARAGARVTVVERRPFLGGRAYSFADPVTGDVIDNGPHLLAGAYTEARDFLHELGAAEKLVLQPRLHVPLAHPRLGMGAVAAPAVPGPLQAPAALLRYRLLSRAERLRVMLGALRLAARAGGLRGTTVARALAGVGQSEAACARFWHPLAIATLNEMPDRAAAAPFAAVLRRIFFAGAEAARFAVATVPLSALYTTDARRVIEAAGGTVRTGATAVGIECDGARAAALVLRDGSRVAADAFVAALPCAALLRVLPPRLLDAPPFRALTGVGTSPIVSVHLWLDRPVGWGAPFLGLLGGRAQWLFDGGAAADGGHRVATVTSGARFWDDASDDAIAAEVLGEAAAAVPALRAARVRRALVVRERHATISLTPAADAVRPGAETPVSNLFLAGDWVATGLPATIEGAVLSGRRAAALALATPAASLAAPRAEGRRVHAL